MQTFRTEQRRHLLFLLLQTEVAEGLEKVLNGKKSGGPTHYCNSDSGDARAENIAAVAGRMHPSVVNSGGIFSDGNVFRDVGEAGTGSAEAFFETGLPGKLVLHDVEVEHQESVLARGFEERIVPFQFGEIVCGALAVEQLKQFALGFVALKRLRLRAG